MSANVKQIIPLFNIMTKAVVTCNFQTCEFVFILLKNLLVLTQVVCVLESFVTSDSSRKLCATLAVSNTVAFCKENLAILVFLQNTLAHVIMS